MKFDKKKKYKVWCEYDMDWNVNTYEGIYEGDKIEEILNDKCWEDCEVESWKELMDDGLLQISIFEE